MGENDSLVGPWSVIIILLYYNCIFYVIFAAI